MRNSQTYARYLFMFSLLFFALLYGLLAMRFQWFPARLISDTEAAIHSLKSHFKEHVWYFIETDIEQPVQHRVVERMAPGLTKLVSVQGDFSLDVRVIDDQGSPIHQWRIAWHDVWPDAPDYLTEDEIPKNRPGTIVHGAEIMENGDLVFNFEHLGMVRMDPCGHPVWRLPFRTHHSLFRDDDGNFWVSGQINHAERLEQYPLYDPPFIEPVILKVSPDGEILLQKSLFDLLAENNLLGLLYTTSRVNHEPRVSDDTLHLNDVEVFSSALEPGFFQPGDVMVSLRNINTVLVFEADTWRLKYRAGDEFVRQHDPDFIDGNRISIYDNHTVAPREQEPRSRILVKNVNTDATRIAYEGTAQQPFFSAILGKHQWLANGNMLITEGLSGRVFEIDPSGEILWDFYNLVEAGWLGIVQEAERLPLHYDANFFTGARQRCDTAATKGRHTSQE